MYKKIFYFFIYMMVSVIGFAQVIDDVKLLKDEDKTILQERIEVLEKKFGVEFRIVITAAEIKPENYLKELDKGIVLNIVKDTENKKLRVKLFISKEIDVNGYKDQIDNLLLKSSNLVDNGYYVDLIYEITGNVAEIINLIKTQEKENGNENVKRAVVIFMVVVMSIAVIGSIVIFVRHQIRRNVCRYCDIEMDLVDEYEENEKNIRLYSCHVCGHSKKISFRHQ